VGTVTGMQVDEGRLLLPYLRAYRHRVANHVQVAAGWLELGDNGQARAALEVLRRRLQAEARLAAALPQPLAGLVLGLALLAEEQGIEVSLEAAGGDGVSVPADPGGIPGACRELVAG